MSTYRLTYFNLRARGEFIRLIFAAAGVTYEDVRIEIEQWPALKQKMPFYQLPMLEEDGFILIQSRAIGRYLSNKYGLAGKSDRDKARADMIVDCFEDMVGLEYKNCIFAKDEESRAAGAKKYIDETLSVALPALEKILIENNGGDGYFVGDQLTWADIRWFHVADLFKTMKVDSVIVQYPKLNALLQRVGEQPGIKKWLASRPQTAF